MPIQLGNSPRTLPPSLQPGPTSPGREVYVGREIQRAVNKMAPQVRSNRCDMFGNRSGVAERMLGSGLQQVSQSFFNGLSYNVQRGILEGYDRKHGTNMCQYPRRNGRYHITDRGFYNRCYNDIHDYENACDRALFGVDNARCGMFGPTACRQVWGCPCANTKEFAPVPYIACPPLHKCETPHATQKANVEQKKLKKEVETIRPEASQVPEIQLPPKVGEYQIQSIEALSHALSYQNDVAQTDLDNSMEAEQIGASAKEHAIAEYIQHLLYTEGRTASEIGFDIQGQAVIINGAQIETGNPVSKEKVYEILHQKILEEGGIMDTVASRIRGHAQDFNPTEKKHYYGPQVIGKHFQSTGAFKKFLLECTSGDSKQQEALKCILGKHADALNKAMQLTRRQYSKHDEIAGKMMMRENLNKVGIDSDHLFNFNLRENARSGAFQTGLAITALVGMVFTPLLLYKAFKENAPMTWAGIAVVLLGVPLATGKGIFSTTKELWSNLLDADGMETIVGSKRETLLGSKENIDLKNKEAFAEFFLGQSTHFRHDELAALSGQAINTNPSTQAEKDLNATRILLKVTAQANNISEDKLLGIIEDGRNEKMNRLQIKEIRPAGTGTEIVYQGGKVTPTNMPWRESNMTPIPTTRLVESQTLFPAGVPFELSYDALEQRSRSDGVYNDANANNKIETIVKYKIAPEAKALAVSMGLMIDETGKGVKEGVTWAWDRTKKAFKHGVIDGLYAVADDSVDGVRYTLGKFYEPMTNVIVEAGGAIKVVGKDAFRGVELLIDQATGAMKHIQLQNYAGVGDVVLTGGAMGKDILSKVYNTATGPVLSTIADAIDEVSLDVSKLAKDVWDAIFDDIFESDGSVSQTNLIPYKLRESPETDASEFSKLLHKALLSGKTTIETSRDVLFATGGKYVRVSKEKMQNAWNVVSNQASEFGTQITTLPARTRLQLATLGGIEPPHPVISANPGLLDHLDAGEAAFVAHTLNVIHHSKTPIPKNLPDRILTWDWSWGSRNMIPRWEWIRKIIPGGPDPDTLPTFGQQVGATYNFQAYTTLYQHRLKEWAQEKLDLEARKNGGAINAGTPPRTATAREKTLLAIQNLDT